MREKQAMSKRLNAANLALIGTVLILALGSCAQDVKLTAPRYALVYGVSTYCSTLPESSPSVSNYPNLGYSDDDAKSMADLLQSQGWTVDRRIKGSAVSSDPTKDSTSPPPTKQQMLLDIAGLASTVTADSTVLLYFSGHGDIENDTPYIVPYLGIADSTSVSINLANMVSPADLQSMLTALPTKNIIVIFDTCYSGGFVAAGSSIDSSPQDYSNMPSFSAFSTALSNFGNLLSANAAAKGSKQPIVLSAAGSIESSYDGDTSMKHGVFTWYLLKAAVNGDTDGDGVVTMSEAYAYTCAQLQAWGATQVQQYYAVGYPFLPHLSGGARDLVLFAK